MRPFSTFRPSSLTGIQNQSVNFRRSGLIALACTVMASGCAVVDPHNIIGRIHVPPPLADTPVPNVGGDAWKQAALDYVWNTVNEKYYDAKLNGVDWRAVRTKYEPMLGSSKTDDEYWELLDKMTGELKDSHTRVQAPKQVAQQRMNESHSLGFTFLEQDGALLVTGVNPDSDAYWAGVRAGMTVKTINSEPALKLYQRLMLEVRDSSTGWARSRGVVRKISAGEIDTKVDITFARMDGSEISATIKRRAFKVPPEFTERILPSGFGYISFSNFVGGLEGNILKAIDKMKTTPGMIVDLRNNGGGSLSMSGNLVTKFLSDKTKGTKILTRTGKAPSLFFIETIKLEPELNGSKETAYANPLVILTNQGSASASEVFAATLQDLGRATVIGARTCGCLLGYMGYADIPGGGQLAYSEMGFVTPKGKRVEGEGVMPDIEVKLVQADFAANRDRGLEAAVEFLKQKTATTKSLASVTENTK
jgi:carboxyl-terminal processing protease